MVRLEDNFLIMINESEMILQKFSVVHFVNGDVASQGLKSLNGIRLKNLCGAENHRTEGLILSRLI